MKRIRRGTFRSVPQLKAAIQEICQLSADSEMSQLIQHGVRELPRFNTTGISLVAE